jgi:GTPase Era involved in 16S rRNA processing
MTPSSESDAPMLRSYMQLKLRIAANLRGLREILYRRGDEARQHRCEQLMAKLAEDRFTLAVLGQLKRGKSSLMNAIIGRELLPTGVLPLTSAITVLKFGPEERLVIRRENLQFPQIVPVAALADYVTERGNPGNRKKVRTATVELPLPFLRRGMEFVDTPGVGSAIEANTATTYAFLPQCDAVLFLTGADTPLTSAELQFLRTIREHAQKIFFVVNKMDLLGTDAERTEVLDFVARILRQEIGKTVRIFALSARAGVAARLARDPDSYARSGLREFEEALATFLSQEKASVFLAAIIERALRLLEEETGEVALYKKARELSEKELRQGLEIVRGKLSERGAMRQQSFERLREHLIAQARNAFASQSRAFSERDRPIVSRYLDRILSRAGWSFGAIVAERCAAHLTQRLVKKIERSLCEHDVSVSLDSDKFAREQWARIQSGIAGSFADANEAFAIPNQPAAENLFAWDFTPKLEARLLHGVTWQSRLPAWLACAPAVLTRPALKRQMESAYEILSESVQTDVLKSVTRTVSDAVDRLARSADDVAAGIESRILAAIIGERPTRPAARQGMRAPEKMNWGTTALVALRAQLEALRDQIAFGDSEEEMDREEFIAAALPATSDQPAEQVIETDFAQRAESRGCPVCDELEEVAFDFFAHWQYALAVEEKTQIEFASERGFCPQHTWQLQAISSNVGGSAGFAKLIERTSQLLEQNETESPTHALAPDRNDCRVCRLMREAESESIRRLGQFIGTPSNREIYARSQGVCLRHLEMAISASPNHAAFLRAEASRRFQQIAEDLQSYALKRDASRHVLTNADERDAFLRAIIHLAGARNLSVPWPNDDEEI